MGGDDADSDPVRGVGPGKGVHDVERLLILEVGDHLLAEAFERFLLDRLIEAAPADPVLGLRLLDDELVLRRAAREPAGVHDDRTAFGQLPLSGEKRMGVQKGRGRIPEDPVARRKAVVFEPRASGSHDRHFASPTVERLPTNRNYPTRPGSSAGAPAERFASSLRAGTSVSKDVSGA